MPAPSCPHHSMQSTVGRQGRMLGERDALGAMLGAEGMGQGIGPRPRAPAHMAIKMLGHPYAQEPALLARFTQEARAAASLSHPNIVAVFDSGSEAGMHDLAMEYVEAQSDAAAPTSRCRSSTAWRQGRRAGRRARQGPGQAGPAGGRRLPPGRGARRPRRGPTGLTGRGPGSCRGRCPSQPVTRAVHPADEISRLDGTNTDG
jgi:hypothetical protein